tara:strand:- start:5574 stop:5798 length:225 start_codon:yes stop_codon:yes gene_type:complete
MSLNSNPKDEEGQSSITDWVTQFSDGKSEAETAELAAKFMFAMSYYHEKMKLHILLHPLFYLAGFLTAYYLGGE